MLCVLGIAFTEFIVLLLPSISKSFASHMHSSSSDMTGGCSSGAELVLFTAMVVFKETRRLINAARDTFAGARADSQAAGNLHVDSPARQSHVQRGAGDMHLSISHT